MEKKSCIKLVDVDHLKFSFSLKKYVLNLFTFISISSGNFPVNWKMNLKITVCQRTMWIEWEKIK